MATPTTAGTILDFVKTAYEGNKPALLTAIQAGEGGVEAFLVNAIKNAPKPGGIIGTLFPLLEGELTAYVQNLVAKNGPEVVFDFIDRELTIEAKALGG